MFESNINTGRGSKSLDISNKYYIYQLSDLLGQLSNCIAVILTLENLLPSLQKSLIQTWILKVSTYNKLTEKEGRPPLYSLILIRLRNLI